MKSDSQSVKEEECELICCGSTAGGPHLNGGDLRRVYRLHRYARLRFCFVNDTGDLIAFRGSTLLAPARPAAKGKLFTSVPEAKIVERKDVIS